MDMNNDLLKYLLIGVVALFVVIVLVYLAIRKRLNSAEAKSIRQLREGTQTTKFSSEVLYQRLYVIYLKVPLIKRYILKLRRRLEIINIDDEYLTRKQASQILTRAILLIIPVTIFIIVLTNSNSLLMFILLVFEIFIVDTVIDGMVDKIDNRLLDQQIEFFAEMRHAYHEYNMVEEAIYQVSQDDEKLEMSRQAEKIYEILISDDPEDELEKYYDVAPNNYLKEFAGISYLTREFGDRTVDGASLYLKNLNNITQEMQLEILKRDKLNYVFQSLSIISILPMLFLEPIKNWAIDQFSFTAPFYQGKQGLVVQMLVLIITFVCYLLTRKLKDNGSVNTDMKNTENPIQAKVYKIKPIKKIIDLFMPKDGTKDYRKFQQHMKEAATKQKMEWIFVNRLFLTIIVFIVSVAFFFVMHKMEVNYVYTEPTADYNIVGQMADKDLKKAEEITKEHNIFLDRFRGKLDTTQNDIQRAMRSSKYYRDADDTQIETHSKMILEKLQKINKEYIKWFEILLSMVFALAGYMAPYGMIMFQARIRQMEMEDEVMQFHTIILMLMRIERVNVEMILDWLERYSDIFKGPISKCLNNYESGAWEALEQLKEDTAFPLFTRIVESLQSAVEKIPIRDAFDELDSERDYYQSKRKESNERLISRKGMMGKAIGFAPMIVLFVGYLIVPLMFIGLTSMSTSFDSMQT